MTPGRLGALPDLEAVRQYLQERDTNPPTSIPRPQSIRSESLGNGWRYDRIVWDYAQLAPPLGLPADGFVVYWSLGDTTDPGDNSTVVAFPQRSFSLFVPETQAISYAVAAHRYTHVGQQVGHKAQLPAWKAVV